MAHRRRATRIPGGNYRANLGIISESAMTGFEPLLKLAMLTLLILGAAMSPVSGCIWDSDTLGSEKRGRPKLADIILNNTKPAVDVPNLQARLDSLLRTPRPEEPSWINDVAGAHLRLGQAQKAAELLIPAAARWTNDYGIHANLGTTYHLMGRYADAEHHIARDLELNPDAHFGLEKFHLALLQYLVRPKSWQEQRLYVDEFSTALAAASGARMGAVGLDGDMDFTPFAGVTNLPPYRELWNLATVTNLEAGLIYMAELNPREPAVFEALGAYCWRKRDLNLAVAAFERAIQLGSPKRELLVSKVDSLREHIRKARLHNPPVWLLSLYVGGAVLLCIAAVMAMRRLKSPRRRERPAD